jgi:beta-galactosidase
MIPKSPRTIPPGLVVVLTGLATWLALVGHAAEAQRASRPAEAREPGVHAVDLPPGVHAVWDLSRAHREKTPTRERICINGLWRWQPAASTENVVPEVGWGYFKVPGSWPGITSYLQKDSQTVHAHPNWKPVAWGNLDAAWYQREFTVPADWAGRRIGLNVETLNSFAAVFLDGNQAGEIRFPGGEADLTALCRPGSTHQLSLLVLALPLKGVMLSYSDSASAREVKGSVERRGLCGEVFLVSTPAETRLTEVTIDTSVRKGEITVNCVAEGLRVGEGYSLVGEIAFAGHPVKVIQSAPFTSTDPRDGRVTMNERWRPEPLWDLHTPENQHEMRVSLLDARGAVVDALPARRFGFREFWIEGRDFYLNGTRLFLSAVPLDNAQVGAAAATYRSARESLERLRTFGINFVYTHHYGCEPGAHLGLGEILRAADDAGMLVALTQPHFSQYDWDTADADRTNGYAGHAAAYVRAAQAHPSVVMYATSHNAAGYNEDMNPELMDGRFEERDAWSARNAKKAVRAEAIIRSLDPGRIVYHHASGNLGAMHSSNFYPNFVPVQELSDWFEPWATRGTKPLFLCEYGAPFTWDWAMYRGWYQGKREFGSAAVPWEFCLAEWNAQFFGDRAFPISDAEKRNLRWEARQFRDGRLWHRWDYPHSLGSTDFVEREPVFARYFTDNWRAFRTWGVSANSPWEHDILFRLRPGLARNQREALPVDWTDLQRPGFSPDYLEARYERMDLAYDRADWIPTAGARALIRNNRPLLAYLAGKPARFTSQDHLFRASETVEKQIVVINNSRVPVRVELSWTLELPQPIAGHDQATVETGQQTRIPLRLELPDDLPAGAYPLRLEARFNTGETQEDEFLLHIVPRRPPPRLEGRIALFDPRGETTELLRRLGVRFETVEAGTELQAYDALIVGQAALDVSAPAPDLRRVRDGLKVLVFEQTAATLEQRLGFRVAEYGLRHAFLRVPDHPALAGLRAEQLRDWRGQATLLPPRLTYELNPRFNGAPTVSWCGLPVTRAWRCGNQGNVASVLIEKPVRGDFLPLIDGGFSLQYSPLMEYREGAGLVLFCQLDVTARTESDPAAENLVANLLDHLSAWKPAPARTALYAGDPAGRAHLQAAGFQLDSPDERTLTGDRVLVVGSGGAETFSGRREVIETFLNQGGRLLGVGLKKEEADALLPFEVAMTETEHISTYFDPPATASFLAGVGPADLHNRDPRALSLIAGGAMIFGNGVLATATNAPVVFCQVAPWQFDHERNPGLKRTFRRTSFLLTRVLANLGVAGETPLLDRFAQPLRADERGRWLEGFYLDQPEEWDDPYRFFRW